MRPRHDRRPGEVSQGCGVSGGGPVGSLRGQGSGLGGLRGPGCGLRPRRGGCQGLWWADGVGVTRPKLHSASEYPVSGRIRTRSVQPSAIRSAQGRA